MSESFIYIDANGIYRTIVDNVNTFFLGEDGFGLEGLEVIEERTPFQHGATRRGHYLSPRDMLLRIGIMANTFEAWREADNNLLRILNPLISDKPGILRRITADGRTRDIRCWLVAYAKPSEDRHGFYSERVLKFHAPDPFFFDPAQNEEDFAVPIATGLSFPLSFPMSYGSAALGGGGISFPLSFPMRIPSSRIDGYVYVYNAGDVETWPTVRITGKCDNPCFKNETTDKVIEVMQKQDNGDYIEIDMEAGTVVWYDATTGLQSNVIETLTAASEFWPLVVEENTLHITAENASGATVTVSWYNRYLSV